MASLSEAAERLENLKTTVSALRGVRGFLVHCNDDKAEMAAFRIETKGDEHTLKAIPFYRDQFWTSPSAVGRAMKGILDQAEGVNGYRDLSYHCRADRDVSKLRKLGEMLTPEVRSGKAALDVNLLPDPVPAQTLQTFPPELDACVVLSSSLNPKKRKRSSRPNNQADRAPCPRNNLTENGGPRPPGSGVEAVVEQELSEDERCARDNLVSLINSGKAQENGTRRRSHDDGPRLAQIYFQRLMDETSTHPSSVRHGALQHLLHMTFNTLQEMQSSMSIPRLEALLPRPFPLYPNHHFFSTSVTTNRFASASVKSFDGVSFGSPLLPPIIFAPQPMRPPVGMQH